MTLSTAQFFLRYKNFNLAYTKEHTMPKAKEETLIVEDLDTMDLSKLDEDSQIDLVLALLEQQALNLEQRGIDMEVIDSALFSIFVGRLAERGDKESFDAYVEEAQDEPWTEITLH